MLRIVISGIVLTILASHLPAQSTTRPSGRIWCQTCGKAVAGEPAFRLRKTVLGQPFDSFDPWIAHLAGGRPVVLQTPRATLVAVLDGGAVDALADDEVAHLRAAFPTLGASAPTTLDAHQQAHLLAFRLLKIEDDLRSVLDLDDDGRARTEAGPWQPLASDQVEIFAISNKTGHEAFTAFLFDHDAWPLAGTMLESGPTAAALMPSLKEPSARRQFAFMSAMQLLRGLSRASPGLQGWMHVGLAHVMEDRHAGKAPRSGATLPPGSEAPKDWESFVGDLVAGGKSGELGALAATPAASLSVRSRLQAWSLVRWMMEKDPAKFAEVVRHLLHSSPTESPQKALLAAVRPALGHDLVSLLDAWKEAVRKRPTK